MADAQLGIPLLAQVVGLKAAPILERLCAHSVFAWQPDTEMIRIARAPTRGCAAGFGSDRNFMVGLFAESCCYAGVHHIDIAIDGRTNSSFARAITVFTKEGSSFACVAEGVKGPPSW